MKFYVYVYLDPLKPGNYYYGNYIFDYEPFYVGYGRGNRYLNHISESMWNITKVSNIHKRNRIRKIMHMGSKPLIIKVCEDISFDDAISLEVNMVKCIGRRDKKTGPLTNLTDAGEGRLNSIVSDKTKKKLSETCSGKLNGMYGKHQSEETKKIIGFKNSMHTRTDKMKKNMSKVQLGELNSFYNKHHSEQTLKTLREKCPRYGEKNSSTKKWRFIDPYGKQYDIIGGFDEFCSEHKLSRSLCHRKFGLGKINTVIKGNSSDKIKNTQGWEVICTSKILTKTRKHKGD